MCNIALQRYTKRNADVKCQSIIISLTFVNALDVFDHNVRGD